MLPLVGQIKKISKLFLVLIIGETKLDSMQCIMNDFEIVRCCWCISLFNCLRCASHRVLRMGRPV